MNIKTVAVIFGLVVLVAGILGFIPGLTVGNRLLGIFEIDGIHNWIHILTGIIGLIAAIQENYARLYFKVVGIIYAILTIFGFLFAGNLLITHVNTADNLLHLVIAIVTLYFGFVYQRKLSKPKND